MCYYLHIYCFCLLKRGPHKLRERVGRAEAQVASMLTESTVNAILLPNASVKTPIIQLVTYAPRGSLSCTLCVRFNIYALRLIINN